MSESLVTRDRMKSVMAHHQNEAIAKAQRRAVCEEALAKGQMTQEQVDEEMLKGVPTSVSDMANLTTIDVSPVAVLVPWSMDNPMEMVFSKLAPTEDATLVAHQWRKVTKYFPDGFSGFVPETGRGVTASATTEGQTVYNKMMAVEADTTVMASHQSAYIEALGTKDPIEFNRRNAQIALMYKADMESYRSRTDTNRLGTSGDNFKGLEQQIEEGTNGTIGSASDFSTDLGGNGHIIDMKGRPLTFDNIRSAGIVPVILHGGANVLLMAPDVMAGLSASMDGAIRLGSELQAMTWGNTNKAVTVGFTGPGNNLLFVPTNTLQPKHYQPKYSTSRPTGAPSSVPTVLNFSVTSDNAAFQGVTDTVTSRWDSNPEGVGSVYWVITYEQDGVESLGTRYPTGSSTQAVTASQQVNFQVQTPPGAQRIKVYRSRTDQSSTATTETWHIFDVATDASGITVFFDNNIYRPNTSRAFGLTMEGPVMDAMFEAGSAKAALASLKRSYAAGNTLGTSSAGGQNNGVRNVHLGPKMGQLDMGRLSYSAAYPTAYYSIRTPLVPDPLKCFVFKNVRAAVTPSGAPYA